ncbi:hypothetical protein CVT25_002879 [Psilocybe cyanescens]|uniref:Uncharacterized protein n=1 Tax=Psilocybe cyanescens TaxID=93625 RepID=A0A409WKV8_PSICY|nr:hypothetical protein CVT25_002879 [Psilocybe cyanescens]
MPYEADLDSETVLFPESIIEILDSTLYASYEKAINLCEISINLDCAELKSITASSIFSAHNMETIPLENAGIPWKKLDILELHISMSRERAVNTLRQCESATSVDIRRISGETKHTYGTKVTLKKLLKLTWGDSSDGGLFKSLESIRTPVLKVLRIKDVFEHKSWFSLASWDDKFEKFVETNLCAESLSKFTVSEEFPDSIQQPSTLMTALTTSGTGALPTFFIVLKDSPDLIYNMHRQNPEIGERLSKLTVWKKEGVADGYKVCIGWTVCNMPSSSKVVRIGDGFRENSNSTKKKWFNDYLKDVEALK